MLLCIFSFKQEIKYGDELSLRNSFFKPGGLTVINLHGFVSPMSYIFSESNEKKNNALNALLI